MNAQSHLKCHHLEIIVLIFCLVFFWVFLIIYTQIQIQHTRMIIVLQSQFYSLHAVLQSDFFMDVCYNTVAIFLCQQI